MGREVILTYGVSNAVLEFLKEAAKFRTFEVIVAESAPGSALSRLASLCVALLIDCVVVVVVVVVGCQRFLLRSRSFARSSRSCLRSRAVILVSHSRNCCCASGVRLSCVISVEG